MSPSPAEEIFKNNDLLYEHDLQTVLKEVVSEEFPVEISLDHQKKVYLAQFLPPSHATDADPDQTHSLFVMPMEPMAGKKLQMSRKIKIQFVKGVYSAEGMVMFKGLRVAAGEQLIQLTFPRALKVTSRRKLHRHELVEDSSSHVLVKLKDKRLSRCEVRDVHMEGLCMVDEESKVAFEKNDQFYLSLNSKKMGAHEIPLFGRLCYTHRLGDVAIHGVEFVSVEDYLSLKSYIARIQSIEPAEEELDLDDLVNEVFG
ncbi:MAG: hypothetical protein HQL54_09785 [Magnetococcales bacterium]|nr:hypothetical protein [Magnetococcales bacterium]